MSCLSTVSQALPSSGTILVAGLTGQKNAVTYTSYDPRLGLAVTFNHNQQSPYISEMSGAMQHCRSKTPNSQCLGSPDAGVPWLTGSANQGAQMSYLNMMYEPYGAIPAPTATSLRLVKERGPTPSCVFNFMDATRL